MSELTSTNGQNWEMVANGVTSQDILACVPGLAVDPLSIRGTFVLTQDQVFHPREINNRRIAARKRRQNLEREKVPLFADEVAAEQKPPDQELAELDQRMAKRVRAVDQRAWTGWMESFQRLAKKSPEDQSKIVAAWNATETPKDHAYFAGFLKEAEKTGLAAKVTDRTGIEDPELRATVERMDKTWRTLKDIERAAKPDSPFNIAGQRLAEEMAKYQSLGVDPPKYVSDKPSWHEIQERKQRERDAKEEELRKEKEAAKKQLLFNADELKRCLSVEVST